MGQYHRIISLVLAVFTVTACATLRQDFETPAVNVSAIRPLPSDSLVPRFEIVLHIVNPNRSPLRLQGIAYTLALDGHDRVVQGCEDGYFIGPTVFTDVQPGTEIHRTEIFGPVVVILKAQTLDEAIQIINDHQYGNDHGGRRFVHAVCGCHCG